MHKSFVAPHTRWAMVAILALAALAVLAACGGGDQKATTTYKGGPRISFDRRALEFGDVPVDKPFDAVYQVSNVGDQPLVVTQTINRVLEGC
ncbi:MAG: hypothetical protein Q8O40_09420 [Chloroflexota bacterium]|nr:hypothetical protein [Chloroflexota bacterium]